MVSFLQLQLCLKIVMKGRLWEMLAFARNSEADGEIFCKAVLTGMDSFLINHKEQQIENTVSTQPKIIR